MPFPLSERKTSVDSGKTFRFHWCSGELSDESTRRKGFFPIAGVADRRHHRRTEEKYASDVDAGPRTRAAERSIMKRCGNAVVRALFLLLVTCRAGWTQDSLREQDHWRTVMGPSVLNVEQEKRLAASPGSGFTECVSGCPTMVVVPAGKFTMGSPSNEAGRSSGEGPQHEVTIASPFAVSKTEVTFEQWDVCVAAGACRETRDNTWGRGDRPAINVSWDDAKRYAAWLSRNTGREYRLLSEAEWEYAARAGSQTRFSFGDDDSRLGLYAWYFGNSDRKSQPVGKKTANAFGLHDMHGNVFEWVEDPWHDDYEGAPSDGSVWLKNGVPSRRVVRSGSWYYDSKNLRSASRSGPPSGLRDGNVGFRLARVLTGC
jgi:formylglycine-generating enzyme required for sulfatase activity